MPCTLALRVNCPSVKFNKMTHYGQSQAETSVAARRGTISLPEAVEDLRQKLGTDPLSAVTHRKSRVRIQALEPHFDTTAFGSEFHGIRQ